MSDGLRIDVALARAAGLPERAANDAGPWRVALSPVPCAVPPGGSRDEAFSPLGLLLTRLLAPRDPAQPPPMPTAAEARLLQAYLQQRIATVLRDAGLDTPPSLRLALDAEGALRLAPMPDADPRPARVLQADPELARLLEVLQRALLVQPSPLARPDVPGATPRARVAADLETCMAWPWWLPFGIAGDARRKHPATDVQALGAAAAIAALLLSWWALSC